VRLEEFKHLVTILDSYQDQHVEQPSFFENRKNIELIDSQVEQIRTQISDIENEISNIQTQIEDIHTQIDDIRTQIDNIIMK